MADAARPPAGRYGRGGYRNQTRGKPKVKIGKEKKLGEEEEEQPTPLDGNLLDGDSLGPQDPDNFPRADSDVGGPPTEVELDKGGLGVPVIGQPTAPMVDVERERELQTLEKEVESDAALTPQVSESEEEEIVAEKADPSAGVTEPPEGEPNAGEPEPVPQPTPEGMPSDEEVVQEMAEEPAGDVGAEGEGRTLEDIAAEEGKTVEEKFGEPDPERQLHQEGEGSEATKADEGPDEQKQLPSEELKEEDQNPPVEAEEGVEINEVDESVEEEEETF